MAYALYALIFGFMRRKRAVKATVLQRVLFVANAFLWPTLAICALIFVTLDLYLPEDKTVLPGKRDRDSDFNSTLRTTHPLNDLSMPTRKVGNGHYEPCLKLLPLDRIEQLQFPPRSSSQFENVRYNYGTNGSSFTGMQTMAERHDSFKVQTNKELHCGFHSQTSGFNIDDRDKEYMSTCKAAVITAIFGGKDNLYQPIGMTNASLSKVCYVAFVDEMMEDTLGGIWRIVVVRNLPYVDHRRNGKIPKMLGHRLLPEARYSIWVDSKYQFRRDPIGVFEALLWRPQASLAISEHGARRCVYREGVAIVRKHKALPEEVDVQLKQYRDEGFPENATFKGHKALAEASVIVRDHEQGTNVFMCLWFNEVARFTARDQLSFPYVLRGFGGSVALNMFPICTRKALVNNMGHKRPIK